MKAKSILLIIAMACSLAASAYVPLVREGVKWVYYYNYNDAPNFGPCSQSEYSIEISGDSVLNDITYKKVFLHPFSSQIDNNSKPIALVREDNKVIYFHYDFSSSYEYDGVVYEFGEIPLARGVVENEWILYDFNDINRTFSNIPENEDFDFRSLFDYVYSNNIDVGGEMAKVYINEKYLPRYIIEGVGYVGLPGMTDICGWLFNVADFLLPMPMGYPEYFHELSYLADSDGNILYKGPAYTYMCDVNEDKKVDGSDLNLLINAVLTGNKRYNYDANGDSAVDGADINEVINFILKR